MHYVPAPNRVITGHHRRFTLAVAVVPDTSSNVPCAGPVGKIEFRDVTIDLHCSGATVNLQRDPNDSLTGSLEIGRLATGGIWVLGGRIASTLLTLANVALVARALDERQMGAYLLAASVVAVLAVIGQFGMHHTAVRLVAEGMAAGEHRFVRRAIRIILLFAGSCALLLWLALNVGLSDWIGNRLFSTPPLAQAAALLGFWTAMLILQTIISEIFRGFQQYRDATIHGGLVTTSLIFVALVSAHLAHVDIDFSDVLLITALSALTGVVWSGIRLFGTVRRLGDSGRRTISPGSIVENSWPLWISSVALLANSHLDLWILGSLASSQEVAVYGTAARMSILISVPLVIVNSVIMPSIARLNAVGDRSGMQLLLQASASIASFPSLALFAIFVLGGEDIMWLLFGSGYGESGFIVAVLSFAHAVNVVSGSCGFILIMTGHQQIMMRVAFASTILLLVAGTLLAKWFGAPGVAAAYALSTVVQNTAMWLLVRRKCGVSSHAVPWRIRHWILSLRSVAS